MAKLARMVTHPEAEGRQATVTTTLAQHAGDIPAGTLRAIEPDLEPCVREGMAAVSHHSYRVVVTREDTHWLADVPELHGAHTYARNLPTLDQAVREVIVLAADLPDDAMPELVIDYDYHTGDAELDTTAMEVRHLRRQADKLAATAAARTEQAAIRK